MIVGYTMLHYGTDYLASALQSLAPYVDKHVILYSKTPTFGSSTDLPCPDSREDLRGIAERALGKKLAWHEDYAQNYTTVQRLYPNADLILEVDADEVWPVKLVAGVLRAWRNGNLRAMKYRVSMQHFWRSFNYVCKDTSWPIRVCVPKADSTVEGHIWDDTIHHFGYARSIDDMRYKMDTSAHKGEWRRGWWREKFSSWNPDSGPFEDLHPVNVNFWNAEKYDKSALPDFMRDHPYFKIEVIE